MKATRKRTFIVSMDCFHGDLLNSRSCIATFTGPKEPKRIQITTLMQEHNAPAAWLAEKFPETNDIQFIRPYNLKAKIP